MAPLSHDLAGIILPYDHFGTHLNSQGITEDIELEKRNFAHAGQILAEVWSNTVINGHPTIAEYIEPDENCQNIIDKDQEWMATHVKESQYCLQIVKCKNETCCSPFRSSYLTILNDRFLPPPMPIVQTIDGLQWGPNEKNATYASLYQAMLLGKNLAPPRAKRRFPKCIPYYFSCPSIQEELPKRICKLCGLYFGTMKSKNIHQEWCKKGGQFETSTKKIRPVRVTARRQRELMCELAHQELEWFDDTEVDTEGLEIPKNMELKEMSGTFVIRPEERLSPWVQKL